MTNPFAAMGIGQQTQGNNPFGSSIGSDSNFLSNVSEGVSFMGQRIVVSGVEKIGKTTLACNAPKTLLVPLEIGYAAMNVAKTPMLNTFEEVMALVREVKSAAQAGTFRFATLAFDSASALERMIHDSVLRRDPKFSQKNATALTMEAALGGYGKAYQFANELFADFLRECDELALYGGINIIITCHVFAAKVIDPAHGEYDTWDLLLHSPKNQKNYGKREMITQWADMVGFLHEPLFITKGEGEALAKANSMNQGRVMGVDRRPSYVAGNRYGISGVIPVPSDNGWNRIADAIYKSRGIDIYNRDVPFV